MACLDKSSSKQSQDELHESLAVFTSYPGLGQDRIILQPSCPVGPNSKMEDITTDKICSVDFEDLKLLICKSDCLIVTIEDG